MEQKSKSIEENLESAEDKTKGVDERAEESEEKRLEFTDKKTGNAEKGAGNIGETSTGKTESKSINEKSKVSRRRNAGFIELAAAVILIALSGGLFLNTRGTRLLYVSVAMGRVSRYFWVFSLAAVVFGVTGLITLKLNKTN